MLQSGWCSSCSLPRSYHPRDRVLSGQSLSMSNFFLFFFIFFGGTHQLRVSICPLRWCQNYTLLHGNDHVHLDLGYLGTKGLLSVCGTRQFYSSHNIYVITTLQLPRGGSARQIIPSTYSSVSTSVVLPLWLYGDVRVYVVGYIFCIIDWHIYRDIFDTIDIMYCRLPYISGGILPLKTLACYIYRPRDTIQ
jgi:hypothetical protein